jgi:DNA-binding transcriptional LysR family regulator
VDLRGLDLNLLLALDALLETRNVTQAGRRIGRSQPAMSDALRRLRELLGDELLVRVGRRFEPTARARQLSDPIREILTRVERTLAERPLFEPARDRRVFSVAVSDYAALLVIGPLLERLGREAPGVELALQPINRRTIDGLGSGEVDLLILPRRESARYPSQHLFSDRWMCAIWSRHPDVGSRMTRERYLELPHLLVRLEGPNLESTSELHLERLGITRRVQAAAASFVVVPFLLTGTRLVALLQERLGRRLARHCAIRLLAPPVKMPAIEERMFWNPRHSSDPAHAWLRGALQEVAAALP